MPEKGYFVKELAERFCLKLHGNPDIFITGIATPEAAKENELSFIIEEKYYVYANSTGASCLLVNNKFEPDDNYTYLISSTPKLSMVKILELFSPSVENNKEIDPYSYISENVLLGENISINPFVFIGKNVRIGNNVTILSNSFIGENSVIGDGTLIYPNVSIMSDSIIGERVIIHSGTVIGSDGYGFIQLEGNIHYKVPQIGNVKIGNDVEIGSNVSVDRGTLGSTIIGDGTKIDNHVHIAHNVEIGKRVLIVAQVGIAGSTKIGSDSIIAGQAGISGHLELGNGCMVLGKSGVTKDFPPNSKISGFPAREHKEEIRFKALLKKLPWIIDELEKLKKLIGSNKHDESYEINK